MTGGGKGKFGLSKVKFFYGEKPREGYHCPLAYKSSRLGLGVWSVLHLFQMF